MPADDTPRRAEVMMEQLAELLRVQGYSPSKQELQEFCSRTGGSWSPVEVQEFCQILLRRKDTTKDSTLFCRVYDPQHTGRIAKRHLRSLMQAVGEPLSDKEWARLEALYGWQQTDTVFVDYTAFAKALLRGGRS